MTQHQTGEIAASQSGSEYFLGAFMVPDHLMGSSGHHCGHASLWVSRFTRIGLQQLGPSDTIAADLSVSSGEKCSLCSIFLDDNNTSKLETQEIIERDLIQISRPVDEKKSAPPLLPDLFIRILTFYFFPLLFTTTSILNPLDCFMDTTTIRQTRAALNAP